MHLSWRDRNCVARADAYSFFSPRLHPPLALDDKEKLATRMRMPVGARSRLIAQHRDVAHVGVPGARTSHRVRARRPWGCHWKIGGVEHSECCRAGEAIWLALRFDIHGFDARGYFHRKNRITGVR